MLKQKTLRNSAYLKRVRELPCCVCGTTEAVHAHHIIGHSEGGMGMKASDYATMPLCAYHHTGKMGIHTVGYSIWEEKHGSQWRLSQKTMEVLLG